MNFNSILDVAEQIQQDRVKLTQEQVSSFDAIKKLIREVMELNPGMAVGVIYVIAAELYMDAEIERLGLGEQ